MAWRVNLCHPSTSEALQDEASVLILAVLGSVAFEIRETFSIAHVSFLVDGRIITMAWRATD